MILKINTIILFAFIIINNYHNNSIFDYINCLFYYILSAHVIKILLGFTYFTISAASKRHIVLLAPVRFVA